MRLEIETAEMNANDAAGVMAMLVMLFPDVPAKLELFGSTTIAVGDVSLTRTGPGHEDAGEVFAPPPAADASEVFAPPSVDGATAPDGSSATSTLAAAAAPPPAAPQAPPAGVEVDSEGLPWDGRIHAATKGKTNGGAWRGKKGAPKDLIEAVTAELKAAMGAPASPPAGAAAAPTPPPAAAPSATQASVVPPPPAAAPVAAVAPPPSDPVTPAPSAAPPPSDAAQVAPVADGADLPPAVQFGNLMRDVTALQTAGRLTAEDVATCVSAVQLPALANLISRPDLIPTFRATMDAMTKPAAA